MIYFLFGIYALLCFGFGVELSITAGGVWTVLGFTILGIISTQLGDFSGLVVKDLI